MAEQAGHMQAAGSAREVSYVIHHLSFGGWLGTVNVSGRQPRPFDNRGHVEEGTGAAELVYLMFKDVVGKRHRRGEALARVERGSPSPARFER